MPANINQSNFYAQLRARAEAQLQAGASSSATHWSVGLDALRLLHRLSSHPDNAEDALKLLHELQVHQVELDLQNQEIAANEQELVEDVNLYRELYDSAPVAYFLVDFEGKIIQGNSVAAELFGSGHDDLQGLPIDTLLLARNRPLLHGLLQRVAQSGERDSCIAEAKGREQGSQHLKLLASTSPGREHILLVCCECTNVE